MKNYMKINDEKTLIIMDKTFFAKSRVIGSEEYKLLQAARKDYPNYTLVRKEIKKPNHAIEHYKGLSYAFMDMYIRNYEPEASKEETLSVFEQMKDIAKAHAPGSSFNTIKKWFLRKYPEIDTFIIKKEAED